MFAVAGQGAQRRALHDRSARGQGPGPVHCGPRRPPRPQKHRGASGYKGHTAVDPVEHHRHRSHPSQHRRAQPAPELINAPTPPTGRDTATPPTPPRRHRRGRRGCGGVRGQAQSMATARTAAASSRGCLHQLEVPHPLRPRRGGHQGPLRRDLLSGTAAGTVAIRARGTARARHGCAWTAPTTVRITEAVLAASPAPRMAKRLPRRGPKVEELASCAPVVATPGAHPSTPTSSRPTSRASACSLRRHHRWPSAEPLSARPPPNTDPTSPDPSTPRTRTPSTAGAHQTPIWHQPPRAAVAWASPMSVTT